MFGPNSYDHLSVVPCLNNTPQQIQEAFNCLLAFLKRIKVGQRNREAEKGLNSSLDSPVLSWGHTQPHDSVPIHPMFPPGMNHLPALSCSILYKA